MPRTSRVLNVFLASPDDVKPERVAAEELVEDLNKIIRSRLGWTIWLYKWEDTTPGFGRPQEIGAVFVLLLLLVNCAASCGTTKRGL